MILSIRYEKGKLIEPDADEYFEETEKTVELWQVYHGLPRKRKTYSKRKLVIARGNV